MNLENLTKPIDSQSIEEHEKILINKISEIALQYIDLVFSKKIPPLEKEINTNKESESLENDDDLGFLLERYTPVLRDFMIYHITQKENEEIYKESKNYNLVSEYPGEYADDLVEAGFINQITELYQKDHEHWIEETMQLLVAERKKAEIAKKKRDIHNSETKDDLKAGILNFEVSSRCKNFFKDSDIAIDIKNRDTCILIHLNESLYKKTFNNSEENISFSKSLQKLAVEIVKNFPETKAVIAKSWIMDTPIAERTGFKIYKRENYDEERPEAFWWQFINSNGQIDNIRVKEFLETGKAPYRVATGAIMTEDFLKKYLPKEYRGKISLKQSNPDFNEKQYAEEKVIHKEFRAVWDILDEREFKKMLSQSHYRFMQQFNESDVGKGFFDLLLEFKKEHKTKKELEEEPRMMSYEKSFEKFIKSIRFINKEVVIE